MKGTKLPVINRSVNAVPVWYHQNWNDFPTSEQRSEYVTHKLAKSVDFSPSAIYRISKIPFDDFSEHKSNFVKHSSKSQSLLRRKDQIQFSKMPIVSSTNYNDDFKNKGLVKLSPFRPDGSQLEFVFKNKENFPESLSMYQADYKRIERDNNNKKTVTFKPMLIDNQGSATDYQENFKQKPPTRMFLPYPVYKSPKTPFATETSYNLSFVKYPYSKEGMIIPIKSSLSFDEIKSREFSSTYKSDFIKRKRDIANDGLNIFQNNSSLMQNVNHDNWYEKEPSQEFQDYSRHVFYQT